MRPTRRTSPTSTGSKSNPRRHGIEEVARLRREIRRVRRSGPSRPTWISGMTSSSPTSRPASPQELAVAQAAKPRRRRTGCRRTSPRSSRQSSSARCSERRSRSRSTSSLGRDAAGQEARRSQVDLRDPLRRRSPDARSTRQDAGAPGRERQRTASLVGAKCRSSIRTIVGRCGGEGPSSRGRRPSAASPSSAAPRHRRDIAAQERRERRREQRRVRSAARIDASSSPRCSR